MGQRAKVVVIFGTRPEAIKLAPVILELKRRTERFEVLTCSTGQHREMLEQSLAPFGFAPDTDLGVMSHNQSLSELAGCLFPAIDRLLQDERPDWVILQGDTLTVAVGALVCHFRNIRFAHVEAGLRSFNKWHPFPEEINRRIATLAADLNFAPTDDARLNLLNEGVDESSIVVCGNTVVDALLFIHQQNQVNPPKLPQSVDTLVDAKSRILLVTAHRRENFGERLHNMCMAIKDIAKRNRDLHIVYPVHLNPNVRAAVLDVLAGVDGILLTDPLSYPSFVRLMSVSRAVLTDSGGIQEEAPTFGVPVLIMRDVTERQEGVEAGTSVLVGTERKSIVESVEAEIAKAKGSQFSRATNPFGDGRAACRIADSLELQR